MRKRSSRFKLALAMNGRMQIRVAIKRDVPAISDLLVVLTTKFIASGLSDIGKENLLKSMQSDAINSYFDQGFRYHVGEIGSQLIGVVATRDNSHLYHLFVRELDQGNGYSRRLWEVAKSECIAAGNISGFTVNSSLNAQGLYRDWGFLPIEGIRERNGVKDRPMKLILNS